MTGTSTLSRFTAAAALLLLIIAVSACDCTTCSTDNQPSTSILPMSYVYLSTSAPPATVIETIPADANSPTTTWRPGYWSDDMSGFTWVSGEVISKPSPTAVWAPDRWAQHDYGWAFIHGHWQ
jgi:WXXGXW repeat (2 copies)